MSTHLDEAALVPPRRVARADEAPLRGLQRARPRELPSLLHVRANARHVPETCDVREPLHRFCHALLLHPEALQGPVPRRKVVHEAVGDGVLELTEYARHVDLRHRAVRFREHLCREGKKRKMSQQKNSNKRRKMKNARAHLVDVALHLRVEVLEKVFEEQREQSACELEPLVAVVILVRKVASKMLGGESQIVSMIRVKYNGT